MRNQVGIDYSKVIENDSELLLYKELCARVVNLLSNNVRCDFNQLVKYVGGSDRRMLRLLNEMVLNEIIYYKNGHFTSMIETSISSLDFECKECNGNSVSMHYFTDEYLRLLELAYLSKPIPTFIFDQRPVNFRTILDRVAYFTYRGDIHKKKIAIVGDDDITSIGIALLGIASKIVVYDIDKLLLDFIREFSKEHNLDVECVEIDLFSTKLDIIDSDFDVFITDPTPEPDPFLLFINFCTKLLDPNGVGYISFYSTAMRNDISIQRILMEMNYLITDLKPLFTSYAFLKETYHLDDFELLKKFTNNTTSSASFYETLCRVERINETCLLDKQININDILGKATKRVIKQPELDPRYKDNMEFVLNSINNLSK